MTNHEYQPISETDNLPQPAVSTPRKDRRTTVAYLFNIFIFVFGLAIGYASCNWRQTHSPSSKHLVPSPADESVDGKPLILTPHHKEYGSHHQNPYTGFPTPEKDKVWMELMDGYSIRVPKASVDAVGLESIPLNDDSGDVWVSMNIYHHLHCLDSIRHQVAGIGCKDPGRDVAPEYFPPHIDHCLETLRQRLICQPDLGVRAVAWDPSIGPGAVKANNTVNAECVDWNAVHEWTREHTFSPHDGLITQPDGKIYNGPWTPPPRCGQ